MNPGTFTQIYIHCVFAPKRGHSFLPEAIRERIFQYMSGTLTNISHKAIIINGMVDHVHLLFGLNPKVSISDTIREVKRGSSRMVNENHLLYRGHFEWQRGYGAFSVGRTNLDRVYHYVADQKEHHRKKSFREEYIELLKHHHIPYDQRFLFDFGEK